MPGTLPEPGVFCTGPRTMTPPLPVPHGSFLAGPRDCLKPCTHKGHKTFRGGPVQPDGKRMAAAASAGPAQPVLSGVVRPPTRPGCEPSLRPVSPQGTRSPPGSHRAATGHQIDCRGSALRVFRSPLFYRVTAPKRNSSDADTSGGPRRNGSALVGQQVCAQRGRHRTHKVQHHLGFRRPLRVLERTHHG